MRSLFLALALLVLASCARELGSDIYTESSVDVRYRTRIAKVIDRRKVTVRESDKLADNDTGILMGAIVGGVAGSNVGKGSGQTAGTLLGGTLGAVAGSMAQRELTSQSGWEYVVQIGDSPDLTTVVQTGEPIPVGTEVYLIEPEGGGGRPRIRPRG